jgi:hypothetical protein
MKPRDDAISATKLTKAMLAQDPKFRRNHRHALHGTMKALKEVKEGKRDAA